MFDRGDSSSRGDVVYKLKHDFPLFPAQKEKLMVIIIINSFSLYIDDY